MLPIATARYLGRLAKLLCRAPATSSSGPPRMTSVSIPIVFLVVAHRGIWVEPRLLAEIEYRAKSAEGKVRHPFFRGLREDL